ncbi:hypothetical protein RDABS01_000300, partial [Bienertia sinuspersici]
AITLTLTLTGRTLVMFLGDSRVSMDGWSEHANKRKTWDLMRSLNNQASSPWVMLGDFNEVLYEMEKNGRNPCDSGSVQQFRSVVDELGLKDIPMEGHFYTWSNRRDGDDFLEEKLDRVLANNEWLNFFPDSCANTITWDGSDHFPIVVKSNQEVEGPTDERPKLFRFEARWLHDENFDTFLKEVWNDSLSEGNGQWEECVHLCGQRLKTWDANVYKKVPKRLRWLKKRLDKLSKMHQTRGVMDEIRVVEEEMRQLRRSQETTAWQRCRPLSLRDGDKNTAFFHMKAKERKRKNFIRQLADRDGAMHEDQGEIIKIRLPTDIRCWAGSKDGIFRVKDAYNIALNNDDVASSSSGHDPLWASLWKLKVPPKVLNFAWRACWDILPHNINLGKKRVTENMACIRCGKTETALHVLRECCWAQAFWGSSELNMCSIEPSSFKEWLAEVFASFSKNQVEDFVVKVWQIWSCRNDFIFQKRYVPPTLAWAKSSDILKEFRQCQVKLHSSASRSYSRWSPPSLGTIKINFDAASNRELGKVGIGMVARDHTGKMLMAKARTIIGSWDAELAEAAAARLAVESAAQANWHNVIFEGDAQLIVKALQGESSRRGAVQLLIEDALALKTYFNSYTFNFCFRK